MYIFVVVIRDKDFVDIGYVVLDIIGLIMWLVICIVVWLFVVKFNNKFNVFFCVKEELFYLLMFFCYKYLGVF